jgi:hypothetical protein
MGLTIDYQLSTQLNKVDEIRRLVQSFREFARDLPFEKVGQVLEFRGPETHFERGTNDQDAWFKIKSGTMIRRGKTLHPVRALHIIGFETWPGSGCESANFCLALYPATIEEKTASGKVHEIPTKLQHWCYGSTCKTQYAGNPKNGGVEHFRRCHLCIISLLDFIKRSGLVKVKVQDAGGYWQHRNLAKLMEKLREWNELVAAAVGGFDELIGKQAARYAPIAEFAEFEHLEAKGVERLKKLFDKKRRKRPG